MSLKLAWLAAALILAAWIGPYVFAAFYLVQG